VSAASGGASREWRERRGQPPRRSSVLLGALVAVLALLAGCSDQNSAPDRLMDGSKAGSPPVELEGVERSVLTKVEVVAPSERAGTLSSSCLEQDWGIKPVGDSVERIGVATESVTFREVEDRGVFGCSRSVGPQDSQRRWCGIAYGRLYQGRLRDPRLDILCGTAEEPVGFAWVTPAHVTRYVSVEQPGYVEVYEVAGDLPVRVATVSGVEYERSSARFEILEHDDEGRLVHRYTLEPAVAG